MASVGPNPSRRVIGQVVRRLVAQHGPRRQEPAGPAVDVLAGTILSQNTSRANSSAGYRALREKFGTWAEVADARTGAIERCIRVSGLSRIKAPRIRAILRQIRADRGRIDLEFLGDLPPRAAQAYLMRFVGVGPKTACCVLLFAFGMPVFPVDTHVHRIAARLGLIGRKTTPEQACEVLTPRIRPADRYTLHVLLIAHGRTVCRARRPRCHDCRLLELCPHGCQRCAGPWSPRARARVRPNGAAGGCDS